ncbi:hypothetical protein DJ030_14495 [bacterium endosymbiont of Escarpia laminata]|nr:MAG: hypothetical protein DJ030_14495 [bacterium endosymbiont of Escarpia laminata]
MQMKYSGESKKSTAAGDRNPTSLVSLNNRELTFVENWARSYPYNRYRNYPVISKIQATKTLTDAILEPESTALLLWCRDGLMPTGLVRIVDLPWDSDLYKRRIGRITHLCGDLTAGGLRHLLMKTGFDHLSVRVDASDLGTQRMLTQIGFFMADSILTYLYHPTSGEPPEQPMVTRSRKPRRYREYEPLDRDRILKLTSQLYAHYPGRYSADPILREHAVDRYVRWAEKYLDGDADKIWVSELNGRVVGYLAFRYDRRLYRSFGIGCYGSGLGGSRGGDYYGLLQYALTHTKDMPWQCAEFDTQIDNYPVHRIYQDLKLEYVRAEYTYHLHLS